MFPFSSFTPPGLQLSLYILYLLLLVIVAFFSKLKIVALANKKNLVQSRTPAHHGAVKPKKCKNQQQTTAMFLFSITKRSICFCVVRKWSFPWTRMPGILIKKSVGTPKQKRGGDYQRIVDLTRSIHNKEAPLAYYGA